METSTMVEFINFLQQDLAIPVTDVLLVLRQKQTNTWFITDDSLAVRLGDFKLVKANS